MGIIDEYKEWTKEHPDPDYRCDEIHDFLDRFDKSSLFELLEWGWLMSDIYEE